MADRGEHHSGITPEQATIESQLRAQYDRLTDSSGMRIVKEAPDYKRDPEGPVLAYPLVWRGNDPYPEVVFGAVFFSDEEGAASVCRTPIMHMPSVNKPSEWISLFMSYWKQGLSTEQARQRVLAITADEGIGVVDAEKAQWFSSKAELRKYLEQLAEREYPQEYKRDQEVSNPPPKDPPRVRTALELNEILRSGERPPRDAMQQIESLDQVLAGKPNPKNVVVVHGTDLRNWPLPPEKLLGAVITDPGYTHVLLGPASMVDTPAVLELKLDAGTPAVWMGATTQESTAGWELMVQRGYSFVVELVELRDDGVWRIVGRQFNE